jgi:hypothetical protein
VRERLPFDERIQPRTSAWVYAAIYVTSLGVLAVLLWAIVIAVAWWAP